MEETFDTYTHKTRLYNILQICTVAFFVLLFIWYKYELQEPDAVLIIAVVLGAGVTIAYMFMLISSRIKTYVKDGELTLTPQQIKKGAAVTLLSDVKKIEINAKDYKGTYTSDGSGNRIVITGTNNNILKYRFVMVSTQQRDSLNSILEQWKEQGVVVETLVF